MTLSDRCILVTGAGGFIGSHLCEALVARGALVRALVNYNSRNDWGQLEHVPAEVREQMDIRAGDIRDPFFTDELTRGVDTVFHLAAQVAIPYSYIAPSRFVETNISGTVNVLEAARRHGVRRVIHTSTSEAYGTARYTPIDEDHPLTAQSPYAASKIGADKIAQSYWCSFGTPVVTVRPFNTYGPRQSARAFIPAVLSQILTKDVVRVGALDPRRDMTYVTDTVEGFVAAAITPDIDGKIFNLGSGRSWSMGELLDRLLRVTNRQCKVETDADRIRPPGSEVQELVSDAGRAKDDLGWQCQVDIGEGLTKITEWVAANLAKYKPDVYAS